MDRRELWQRYTSYLFDAPELGLSLDISRMNFDDGFLTSMEPRMQLAFRQMAELEGGSIANPDEGRMVGHYWLRTPHLAPSEEIRQQIEGCRQEIFNFARRIRSGAVTNASGTPFRHFLVIGIGGSALGPQLVADALGTPHIPLIPHFLDNTDPAGIDRLVTELGDELCITLIVVISKSGGTKETRNGMLELRMACEKQGLSFNLQAVAVTGAGSELDRLASSEGWLARFPMWDWVGGRTSVTSAVGLLPAALQGIDCDAFLEGASRCDALTRSPVTRQNPAALLALMWYQAGEGRGTRDMVLLPYSDRLILFSRYLQQLVMESIGKELDLSGASVHQGLSVFGNKGSTDQHAYVQQLRDGINNFFVTFIEVLSDGREELREVEKGVTSGDYLFGFLHGTRQALTDRGRESITITIERLDARTVGALVALYERAVGLYALLVNINAYHQPGVEAGKKVAATIIELQQQVVRQLASATAPLTAEALASAIGSDNSEAVYHILQRLAANPERRISMQKGSSPKEHRFSMKR